MSNLLMQVGAEEYNVSCLYNPKLHALKSETSLETLQLGKQKSEASNVGGSQLLISNIILMNSVYRIYSSISLTRV